ncbi:adenylyl-sulfate kinase [Paenibacillus polymyxa]|uniref:adenylyl-sulfate kinase n=1 Tax=Paenibacillus polymyxa TaxID=1406 RepID=UPI002AB59473|nr:adenylyl-sulfate kinase [Paenibacillus polymyxa]MDY8047372.1 adenylyl-sulfate kinase [Paenibacillus polymyxa]
MNPSSNITWHVSHIDKQARQLLNGHKSPVLWFTGLSGSGKSTVSSTLEKALYARGIHTFILDGDNVRHGLNQNLGFLPADRKENIRRIAEVAKLMAHAGVLTICATISPYREDREMVKEILQQEGCYEIYIQCSLEECERRDPKGMYKKARAGEIHHFTGIDAPYEAPLEPDLIVSTEGREVIQSVQDILDFLDRKQLLL